MKDAWVVQVAGEPKSVSWVAICEVVERFPVREQALALDKAIRKLGPEVQAAVSALSFARQEQFLGARRALNKQQIVPTQ